MSPHRSRFNVAPHGSPGRCGGRLSLLAAALTAAVVMVALATGFGYFRALGSGTPEGATAGQGSGKASNVKQPESLAPAVAALASAPAASEPTWPIWEFRLKEPLPPREQALTPLPWRILGASQSSKLWQLILLRQGKTDPEYFRVGDELPGGYRIEAINEEDVTLRHGRRVLVLSYISSR